jgi:PAS domain-containing protein
MAKRNKKKQELDSHDQIVKKSLNAGNDDPGRAIKILVEKTELRLAYLDRDFSYVWVNPSYTGGTGYGAKQLIVKNHFDLFPNEDHRALLQKAIDTGQEAVLRDTPLELPFQPQQVVTYWDVIATPV